MITSASQMWLTTMLARLPTMTTHFYLNSKLHRNNIPETWLPEELCVPSDSVVRSTTRFCLKSIKTAGQRLFSDNCRNIPITLKMPNRIPDRCPIRGTCQPCPQGRVQTNTPNSTAKLAPAFLVPPGCAGSGAGPAVRSGGRRDGPGTLAYCSGPAGRRGA